MATEPNTLKQKRVHASFGTQDWQTTYPEADSTRQSNVQNGPYPHALIVSATVPNATRRMIPEYHLNAKQETRPSHHKNEKDIMTE